MLASPCGRRTHGLLAWLAAIALGGCYRGASGDGGSDGSGSSDGTAATTASVSASASDPTLTTTIGSDDTGVVPDVGVPNQPPLAMFTATPDAGAATLSVTLDASASSDPDGTIVAWAWSFDDGADEGESVTHDFTAVGCHDVTLMVTDDDDATAMATGTVVVAQGAPEVPGMATVDLAPLASAVLPRDLDTNEGTASFHGSVASQGYTAVLAEVMTDGVVASSVTVPLCGAAPVEFAIDVPIPAELVAHDVRLSLVGDGADPQPFYTATDLVAGDLYLIQGQSNAVASQFSGDANENQGPFLRSFGSNTADGNATAADAAWHAANGNAGGGPGAIGQWGLRMAAQLSSAHAIPIGVVNGGEGGRPISYFQRNDADTTDLSTNYGRALTRMRAAGIESSLRAILWYQGESDGNGYQVHHDGFVALEADWLEDYAGVEQVYVTQIRAGCGGDLIGTQEVQRQLADDFDEITVMSVTGLDAHDGCHYAYENGYRELGDRYAALLGRDLYGETPANDVAPPNPEGAAFANGGTQVVIDMRNAASNLSFAEGAHVDFRLEGAAVSITGGSANGSQVILTLSGDGSAATGITYLGHQGAGPWVLNENGVGLLAFWNLPVAP
ncbi:MAG: PKD domain-containing protein [Deltaproteobacteria bacterium]|nr:PKD domain-containing protein [Deltaproteobacteria bacterium]MBK8714014.1 PKD domain-containing protein [Deltaproteobacteria bacterium]MBP7291187.1 PKD domain-containing protein [Nannocystaceae bacterium]